MMPSIMQTPNRAMLSIIGLYNWDDKIFDLLHLPDGVDPEQVKLNILFECGSLSMLYPDWDFVYHAIDYWSKKELPTWERVYQLTQLEYNPIENYDRFEDEMEAENTAENRLRSSQESRTNSSTSEATRMSEDHAGTKQASLDQNNSVNQVAGFNTNDLATQSGTAGNTQSSSSSEGDSLHNDSEKHTDSGEDSTTGNESNKADLNRNRTRSSRIHGNIGVSTPADMMEKELSIYPEINIVDYIVNSFKRRFCVLVY